jgi:hypothetical protein
MYEFGCFTAFWSNFEIMMEVAIWKLSGKSPKENCSEINTKMAGKKKSELELLLSASGNQKAIDALNEVFNVADRNGWIHGHILNPKGDFSVLTRLRVEKNSNGLAVSNLPINMSISPFESFYSKYQEFQNEINLTVEECDDYIRQIQNA